MMSNDYGDQLKNLGMQLQNIGLNIQNMGMQYPGIIQNQLQNIGIQVSSSGTQIFNYGIQMTNLLNNMKFNYNNQMTNLLNQMNMFQQMQQVEHLNPFIPNINNNIQEECNNPNCECKNPNIIRIILDYNKDKTMFAVNKDQLIEEIFNNYIKKKNLDKNRIKFLYNAQRLEYNSSTKIRDTSLNNGSVITVFEYNSFNA